LARSSWCRKATILWRRLRGSGALATLTDERPRLMATPAAIAQMRAVLKDSGTAARWLTKIVEQADALLTQPPLTSTWGAAPTAGTTLLVPPPKSTPVSVPLAPLDVARAFVLRIQTLGIVWFATEDARYRERATQELLAVCAFPDWRGDQFLVPAEMMFGAATGYDWLFDTLSPVERQAVAGAILAKGIRPGFAEFKNDPPPRWTHREMNWNLVCNGALMIAALAVAEADWPTAARIFKLCRKSVLAGFAEYRPDGGWVEGPGYWHYATQYAVYLIDSLSTALGGDLGLGGSPGFGNTGVLRLHAGGPSGKLFNFADSEDEHGGGYWLFWLGRRYHHPVDDWLEEQRSKALPMDLLWFDPDAEPPSAARLAPHHRFHGIDIAMLRGDWTDRGTTYVGVKGGDNGACDHAHYDLGSFVLDAGGVRWAVDLGPDNYQLPKYFDPQMRMQYYRTSTRGHNTIVVDGRCQSPSARAPILFTRYEPDLSRIVLDMTEAYPGCTRARRGFALIDGRDVVIVDEIDPGPPLPDVVWQMHTAALPLTNGPSAALTQPTAGAATASLFLRIVEPQGLVFTEAAATPGDPPGQCANLGITRLMIALGQVDTPLRLAVVLSPDAAACASLVLPTAIVPPVDAWSAEPPQRPGAGPTGTARGARGSVSGFQPAPHGA
jgi:hypothetical protein